MRIVGTRRRRERSLRKDLTQAALQFLGYFPAWGRGDFLDGQLADKDMDKEEKSKKSSY